eukprot:TRINITY_DN22010_c0_g1_i1.p1 TRINITY_DN22010_c0_g1~~TRINITY_DN22010_c0_g1_i1.p1  ORF type:complete len:246 (+),score=50.72 TRINITY_DN22010_c0_g1_i1:32-739(+)
MSITSQGNDILQNGESNSFQFTVTNEATTIILALRCVLTLHVTYYVDSDQPVINAPLPTGCYMFGNDIVCNMPSEASLGNLQPGGSAMATFSFVPNPDFYGNGTASLRCYPTSVSSGIAPLGSYAAGLFMFAAPLPHIITTGQTSTTSTTSSLTTGLSSLSSSSDGVDNGDGDGSVASVSSSSSDNSSVDISWIWIPIVFGSIILCCLIIVCVAMLVFCLAHCCKKKKNSFDYEY